MTERPTVLLVDADPDLRAMVTGLLSAHAFAVVGAERSSDAIRLVREETVSPEVVLVDCDAPADDLRLLRDALERDLAGVPVVGFSAGEPVPAGCSALGVRDVAPLRRLVDVLEPLRSTDRPPTGEARERPRGALRLSDALRANLERVVADWTERVRRLPAARALDTPELRGNMPHVVRRIADVADAIERGQQPVAPPAEAGHHAVERLEQGFDLPTVVLEYSILRESILHHWLGTTPLVDPEGVAAVDAAIDRAIAAAVERFTRARDRRMEALTRLSFERELAASASEARLRLAAEATGLGMWDWNLATGELTWSRECKAIFGIPDDLVVTYERFLAAVHPDDRERAEEAVRRAVEPAGDGTYDEEIRVVRPTGCVRWIAAKGLVHFEGEAPERRAVRMLGTAVDVTDAHRRSERDRFLADAAAVLSASLDYKENLQAIAALAVPRIADGCAVDIAGRGGTLELLALAHSEAAVLDRLRDLRRRYPPRPEDAEGPSHVLRTGVAELHEAVSDRTLAAAAHDEAHLQVLKSVGLRSAMVVPMAARGRVIGVISFMISTSGRRYDREDLAMAVDLAARAALALDNARLFAEAEQAARSREEILRVVSHDLRNPLGTIRMSADLLATKLGDPPPREVEILRRSSVRMEHLVRDLVDIGSLQAGRLTVRPKPLDVADLLREAVDSHAQQAASRGLLLTPRLGISEAKVLGDRERLLQVFANLVGNAIKFCRPGEQITVSAHPADGAVRFSVSDTGPGIPPDHLPRVFDSYWSAPKGGSGGTGLGLHIARGIVQAHGGEMTIESEVARGTTVAFTVPRA